MYKLLIVVGLLFANFSVYSKYSGQQLPYINYINLPVQLNAEVTINTSAQLRIPRKAKEPVPAVIILHNSAGIDSTGEFYISEFNQRGYATLELDLWGGRGLTGGSEDRPSSPHETLPDAYTALAYLAQHPSINPDKIAIMGFSWGGVVSMLTATNFIDSTANLPFKFAAHIAHYPICYGYNQIPGFEFSDLTGAPVLIQSAELDDYDFPGACPLMVSQIPAEDREIIKVIEYPNVYHSWDRLEPKWVVEDPTSHVGQGGLVTLKANIRTAITSRHKALNFLRNAFDD